MTARAAADPLLSRETLGEAARLYLGDADPADPRVSALHGDVADMPPVLLHVGEDEVLLDDTTRFVAHAEAGGRLCDAHVWAGMTHVFTSNASLVAAGAALDGIGAFLRRQLGVGAT